jgi:hypothetical protein
MQPQGHMPGVHLPGHLVPIGAVVETQRRQDEEVPVALEKRRHNLLLLLS